MKERYAHKQSKNEKLKTITAATIASFALVACSQSTEATPVKSTEISNDVEAAKDSHEIATPGEELYDAWEAIEQDMSGEASVAVYDLQTDETVEWSTPGATTFDMASTIKYAILIKNLLDHQASGVPMSDYDIAQAEDMIENSDNQSATYLWNQAGGQAGMQEFFDNIGADDTETSSAWGITQTTATDQLQVLKVMAQPDSRLSDESKDIMNEMLNNVEDDQHWGVSGGVPDDVPVRLKDGWLNDSATANKYSDTTSWTVNSIGVVGDRYLMAVFTHGNPVGDSRAEQNGIDRIENLSQATWDIMNQ